MTASAFFHSKQVSQAHEAAKKQTTKLPEKQGALSPEARMRLSKVICPTRTHRILVRRASACPPDSTLTY